ncbi:MAG TPA: VIT domain-containing protein [Polyangiaceae bacterium]|nr:VIT domain-containing protein [Polyangiaceae bacterium]
MAKRLVNVLLLFCAGAWGTGGCAATTQSGAGWPEQAGSEAAKEPQAEAPPVLVPAEWQPPSAASGEPLRIHTDPGDLPRLQLASDPEKQLTLEHTHVSAKLNGFVAEVEVSQTYTNPFREPIEASYVFPLPENSAVNHMRMVIDKRVIEAEVKQREQAKRIYEQAKRSGHTAALLEQERPNVFTQSVANIEPAKKIEVVVRYLQDLTYDAGAYEFVFPMVVGPRFMPGAELIGPPAGDGTKADTIKVPDAARISPPYVGVGQRSGRSVSLELMADASLAVSDFEVPTHEVVARRPADGTLRLTLAEKNSIPNRDFVLRYRVAGEAPKATLLLSGPDGKAAEQGYFSLVVQPPNVDVEGLVGQREIVFVVDVSGSMSGQPLAACKSAMREALRRLRPVDTFNILTFAGGTKQAFESARPANTQNVRQALQVVDRMSAGGGTHMADAVQVALRTDGERGRSRYVFFMTDGYVGNDAEIIALSHKFSKEFQGDKARVFGFGVGSSVNRYLIDGLSRAGNGLAVYATAQEDALRGVDRFFHYIDRVVLENLRAEWGGGLQAEELFPNPLPDLFASHPVIVHGRYRGKPSGKIFVRAEADGKPFEIPVKVRIAPAELSGPRVLGTLWARQKLTALDEALQLGNTAATRQITQLGLDFHLVTRFTSLVAVDSAGVVGDGKPRKVVEALDQPAGVDVTMAGGERVAQAGPPPPLAPAPSSGADEYTEEGLQDLCTVDPEACVQSNDLAKDSGPVNEVAYAVQQKRGCGCRTAGGPDAGQLPASLAAFLLVAGFAARRTRRSQGARRLE